MWGVDCFHEWCLRLFAVRMVSVAHFV
jgi:hypothetical protein